MTPAERTRLATANTTIAAQNLIIARAYSALRDLVEDADAIVDTPALAKAKDVIEQIENWPQQRGPRLAVNNEQTKETA